MVVWEIGFVEGDGRRPQEDTKGGFVVERESWAEATRVPGRSGAWGVVGSRLDGRRVGTRDVAGRCLDTRYHSASEPKVALPWVALSLVERSGGAATLRRVGLEGYIQLL